MFNRMALRLVAALAALTIMTAVPGCMSPQKRGGEEQEEKKDGESKEKGDKEGKEKAGDKGGEGGGGEKSDQ